MKYYRRIYINEQGFPPELYAEIVQLSPESVPRPGVFMLEAQPGDEIRGQLCEKIATLCGHWGLKKTAGDPGTYGYSVERKYEPEDLLTPQYFWLFSAPHAFKDPNDRKKRDDFGRITLPATQATEKVKMASILRKTGN